MDEDYFEDDRELEQQRDHKVDEVKVELMATLFNKSPESVFYERQIQVLYEDKFSTGLQARLCMNSPMSD